MNIRAILIPEAEHIHADIQAIQLKCFTHQCINAMLYLRLILRWIVIARLNYLMITSLLFNTIPTQPCQTPLYFSNMLLQWIRMI